ncbi:DNA replication and repair protein RecF [Candidatus Saccharibacteria bacterium]|nr:DNA replication and repair protein RecF [Candidatus Saccharibacteria bacterium]
MAVVKKISVENIRAHASFNTTLSPHVTIITGGNGSGKTSIIEALYLSLQGTSFKGTDSDMLRYESPWWRIDIEFGSYVKRSITFDPSLTSGRKKISIDDKTTYRLAHRHKYPVVLFEPDDLRLLHGSPTRRRQFIDRFISQLDPIYMSALRKYERALKQRNNLLKRGASSEDLFVWDITLSEYGAYIIEKRVAFIEQINNQLDDLYNSIANSTDHVSMHYSHTYIGDIKQKLLNDLHHHIERDKVMGFTSTGPHRHDVIFMFNNSPALDVASRGEVRTIVLAIKFIEVKIIEQITGHKPIILLDDVFSELDDDRQRRLLTGNNQVVITSTKAPQKVGSKAKVIKLT